MLSQKRSAASVSAADCFNMSLGAGPLWWSDAPGDATRGPPAGGTRNLPLSSQQQQQPVRLSFRTAGNGGANSRSVGQPWDAVLREGVLYVTPPPHLVEGSKEAFVALLEAAEEKLKCKHVVVVFKADRSDRPTLVRTFMFLGFAVLSPNSPLIPPQLAQGNICMLYNIDE
ncbi:LOW QUALITY PROTEIN: ornithine decarboxylase antizyme [Sitophilus oryzae]|uniref:Ornithine decarboxylase antizyme n=1 Tax=Sitophilus oryzae TaxID=7048 RepID=A0A6J2Y085_SITOR|nr:LOW QUALITY PROTEIN: ornithine decarboxylase antizyme [Sitophilus oryzae]